MNKDFDNYYVFKDSKWIGCDKDCQSPVIIRRFYVEDIKSAVLKITGLGFFEAKINGERICDEKFIPVVSDYEKRFLNEFRYPLHDELTHRIYYCTFDVAEYLNCGNNILEIQLGNGWYRQTERMAEGNVSYGDILKTIYTMEINTSIGQMIICSDGTETWKPSEIVYNNLFIGEVWDCSQTCSEEKKVMLIENNNSVLSEQIGVPDKEIRTIKPRMLCHEDGRKVYDAGENISGVVRVKTSAPRGSKIVLRFAENINEDFTLNFDSTGSRYIGTSGNNQIMTDVFISDGTTRVFEPKFVWHAFRYFEIVGDFDDVEVVVIHSDVKVTAEFNSSSEGLNFLFDAFIRSQLDNMHGSIPSDCPHRERLGYTGDGQVCARATMMMTESCEFYRKWIRDILDCQDINTGHVQHTAPLMGGGGGPGGWGCAIIIVPYVYYTQTGDKDMLRQCYDPMKAFIKYLCSRMDNHLITREEEGGWCLGDWCTLEPTRIPEPFVNSCYFIKSLKLLSKIADIIEYNNDISWYNELICNTENALKQVYYNKETKSFCDGIQGADAYAVWCGISGLEIVSNIADYYETLGHFDTGFLGTDILLEVLFRNNYSDTALKLLESEEVGSFLYMKRNGATTLWEKWNGKDSHNHPMFGACCRQLFESILGIEQIKGCHSYKNIIIAPKTPNKLKFAEGSLKTQNGKISVKWTKEGDDIWFYISVPRGVDALFKYGDLSEKVKGTKTIYYQSNKGDF